MFSRELEAVLTLCALCAVGARRAPERDLRDFLSVVNAQPVGLTPDAPPDLRALSAWFHFNRPILRDRLKLGPIGFGIWVDLLMDDLSESPEKLAVLDLVQTARESFRSLTSSSGRSRRIKPVQTLASVA